MKPFPIAPSKLCSPLWQHWPDNPILSEMLHPTFRQHKQAGVLIPTADDETEEWQCHRRAL